MIYPAAHAEPWRRLFTPERDEAALKAFIEAYSAKVESWIRSKESDADADEIISDVWHRVWRYADRYNPQYAVMTWLIQIIRSARGVHHKTGSAMSHALRDHGISLSGALRLDPDAPPLQLAVEEDPDPLPTPELREMWARTRQVIEDDLTPMQVQCLSLRYYNDMRPDEVAETIGISPGHAQTTINKAERILRFRLNRAPGEPTPREMARVVRPGMMRQIVREFRAHGVDPNLNDLKVLVTRAPIAEKWNIVFPNGCGDMNWSNIIRELRRMAGVPRSRGRATRRMFKDDGDTN